MQINQKPPMIEDIFNIEIIKQKFNLNKSRSEMLVSLFQAILDVGSGNLSKLSFSVKSKSQQLSVYRRIQRFFASVKLCDLECAKLIFAIVSSNVKCTTGSRKKCTKSR